MTILSRLPNARAVTRPMIIALTGAVLLGACTEPQKPPVVAKPPVVKPNVSNVILARQYYFGEGKPADPARAVALLEPEAAKGDPDALYMLGLAYRDGKGVAKDPVKSLTSFEKAASRGQAQAAYLAAQAYGRGQPGVAPDPKKATAYMRIAADGGIADAQNQMALAYRSGIGVPVNDKIATGYFERAAEQGIVGAVVETAESYETGRGVPVDPVWAMRWHERAAQYGIVESQVKFGKRIWAGQGLPVNQSEGLKWLILAAKAGSKEAQQAVPVHRRRMSRADIRAARDEAAAWQPLPAGKVVIVDKATVRFVQAAFNQMGIPSGGVDGRDGPTTRTAVGMFRRLASLGKGRDLDMETVHAIRDERLRQSQRNRARLSKNKS
ncbi:tetratricopeptide repeat protein [Minwuia sp.]|uniref:tetratricopeptide repeat protein n=1 Tax=Minwuia sp. TaxID=2493630 RepID=UPI003A93FF17